MDIWFSADEQNVGWLGDAPSTVVITRAPVVQKTWQDSHQTNLLASSFYDVADIDPALAVSLLLLWK